MKPRLLVPLVLAAVCAILLFVFFGNTDEAGRGAATPPADQVTSSSPAASPTESGALAQEDLQQPVSEVSNADDEASPVREVVASPDGKTWDPADTRWVEVQVSLPLDTPLDESAWVVASIKAPDLDALRNGDGAFAKLQQGVDASKIAGIYSAARVSADGQARLGIPPSAEQTWLVVGGRYVYSLKAKQHAPDPTAEAVSLKPALGAWISGQLIAPSGRPELPLEDLAVKLGWSLSSNLQLGAASAELLRRETLSSPTGNYEFHGVPVGKPAAIHVDCKTLASAFGEELSPLPGEHVRADIFMSVGGTLVGTLVDQAGQPIAHAELNALGRFFFGNPTALLREGQTDASGKFELKAITPGKVALRAKQEGFKELVTPAVELADGEIHDLGKVELDEGLALAGKLSFPDGSPAANARVIIEPDLSSNLAGTAVTATDFIGAKNSAKTDREGNFRITGAGPGPWALSAQLEVPASENPQAREAGNWIATLDNIPAPATDLVLTLEAPVFVEGIVSDGMDEPVTNFTIQAERAGSQWYMPPTDTPKESFQSDQGKFRMAGLRSGSWTFVALQDDTAKSEELKIELPTDKPLSFQVLRPIQIAGRVIDPDGNPVAGAEVNQELELTQIVEAMQGRGDWPKAKSDEDGNFLLLGMPPGAGTLMAKKDGFAPSEPKPYEAAEGEQVVDFELQMRRGATITGEVFESDGKPAAGCMVILQQPTLAERRILNASAEGTFEETSLTPGQWQVQAFPGLESLQTDEGEALDQGTLLASLKMSMVQLEDEETKHVVLGKAPSDPVQVHGRVSLGDAPVSDAAISFIPNGGGGMTNLKLVNVDAKGNYTIQLDEPDSYLVTVQVNVVGGHQNSVEYRRDIPRTETYKLDFEMPLGRVSGQVLGSDGQPKPGARVSLSMEGGLVFGTVFGGHYNETTTDAEGRFDIPYLRPGSYAVAAGGNLLGGLIGGEGGLGRVVTSVKVDEGQWLQNVNFELKAPGSIKGVVRDTAGAPVKDAAIFVRDRDGRLLELFSLTQTNASGTFNYTSLTPGDYTISARSPGLSSTSELALRVVAGEATDVALTMDVGTLLLISISDKSESHVPARVSVLDENGHEMNGMLGLTQIMEIYNNGLGGSVQRVGPVPAGVYVVRASTEDGRSAERKVTARGQAERKVKLRLK